MFNFWSFFDLQNMRTCRKNCYQQMRKEPVTAKNSQPQEHGEELRAAESPCFSHSSRFIRQALVTERSASHRTGKPISSTLRARSAGDRVASRLGPERETEGRGREKMQRAEVGVSGKHFWLMLHSQSRTLQII